MIKAVTIVLTSTEARSIYPEIICEYGFMTTDADALNFVKGACLHAIGDWKNVPDTITFKVIDRRGEET